MSSTNTNAQENYEYIKRLPIVSRLIKENKKMKRKNKDLKKLIKLITRNSSLLSGPIRNGTRNVSTFGGNTSETPNISYQIDETIRVKREPPNTPIHFNNCDDSDSDIEFIDKPCEAIDIINLYDEDVVEINSVSEEEEEEEVVEHENEEDEEEEEEEVVEHENEEDEEEEEEEDEEG